MHHHATRVAQALGVVCLTATAACSNAPQGSRHPPDPSSAGLSSPALARQAETAVARSRRTHAARPFTRAPRFAASADRKRDTAKAAPAVLDMGGGAVIAHPRLVPIVYEEHAYAADVTTLSARLGAGTYWHDAVAEYGVGPLTSVPPYVPATPAPARIDDPGIQAWLAGLLGTALPAPDDDSIFTISECRR